MFPCPECAANARYVTTNFRRYINHLRSCHPTSPIVCKVNCCPRTYISEKSYVRHLKHKHTSFHAKYWLQEDANSVSTEGQEEDGESIEIPLEGQEMSDVPMIIVILY